MGPKTSDRTDHPIADGPTGVSNESPGHSVGGSRAARSAPTDGDPPSKDEIYKVLGNRRRRYVIHYLEWRGRPVSLDELAERIAAWENDGSIESIGAAERKRVYTALQQFHLPKLAEASLVAYDERAGVIDRTAVLDDLDVYLDLIPANDVPWSVFYAGASVAGLVLTGLSAMGISIFSLVSPVAWASTILLIVCLSAAVHARGDRRHRLGVGERPPEVAFER
ncbi:DUF7344 domain-containing protein [Halovivax limisalsi]|uniref:DUF7344 domain-containing protein n=1 Tax=Halovivax limisalsi TaxID=1453760 RepID=UPI001FFD9411|nr:hypothetical protein [Halovivax limisalsi]